MPQGPVFTARALSRRVAAMCGRGLSEQGTQRLEALLDGRTPGGVVFDVAGGEG